METIEKMKKAFLDVTSEIKDIWLKEYLIPCIVSNIKQSYCVDIPKEVIHKYVLLVFTCEYDI